MMPRTYTAREVADLIGVRLATFYRRRRQWEMVDRMPKPICSGGCHRYDRASMDAWLTRFHPHRPPAPANDPEPALMPVTDAEKLDALHSYYRQMADGAA